MTYDLADNLLTKTRTHRPDANTTHTITETVDYDNALRVKQTRHQYDNLPVQILSSMDYTVKNQVATKRIGQTGNLPFLQKEDFTYNNLGWLTGINPNTGGLKGYTNQPLGDCAVPDVNTYTNLDDNDLFSLNLSYEAPNQNFAPSNTPTATGEYGGNITQMVWQVRGRERQVYTLQYDFLNRMTEAHYSELNSIGGRTKDIDQYMEKLTYDARGNILTLQRNGLNASCGSSLIDNLTYNYSSSGTNINRLNAVTDAADLTKGFKVKTGQTAGGIYTYDPNGNLITDPNKGIVSIAYNHLNLPEKITFNDGNIITWLYDASGTKLKKTTTQVTTATTLALDGVPIASNIFTNNGLITSKGTFAANTSVIMIGSLGVELQPGFLADQGSNFVAYQAASGTVNVQDYIGGFEYKNGVLEAVYHAEGRITNINGTLKYEYALKDHLGNTRVMFCDKNNDGIITQNSDQEANEVTQENHYYPFGMAMEGVWSNTPSITDNKYQYNGKELNDDFGLGWMDYGARMYDAAVGRWNAVDPMADAYHSWTTFNYVMGNPIRLIDPNGMYAASETDSKNTWAFAQDGSMVGGSGSHIEETPKQSYRGPTTLAGLFRAIGKSLAAKSAENAHNGPQWHGLTKSDLVDYAVSLGHKAKSWNDTQLGDFFENIFFTWMTQSESTKDAAKRANFTWNQKLMKDGKNRNTVPDFEAEGYYHFKKYKMWSIYEAKTGVDGTVIYLSSYNGQTQGHIDNLAAQFSIEISQIKNGWDPSIAPSLTYITTYGVSISPSVREYAGVKGVGLFHMQSYFKIESGQYYFHFRQ